MYSTRIGPTVAQRGKDYKLKVIDQNGYGWNDVKEFGKKVKKWYEKYIGDTKVEYSTNGETSDTKLELGPGAANDIPQIPTERQINDDNYQAAIVDMYQQYENLYNQQPQATKPIAYQANAAKTATSIKQGGMTKDELIDFNNRHPNETAMGV